jgi:hypothetical protein
MGNIKKWFFIFWKDPVWSKVISTGIIALVSSIGYIAWESYCNKLTLKEALSKLLSYKIDLVHVIIFLSCLLLIYILTKVFSTKKVEYDDSHKDLDKALLNKVKSMLPANGVIAFVREFNFRGAFRNDSVDALFRFEIDSKTPDFEFIDPELNGHLDNLKNHIEELCGLIGENTFPTRNPNVDANRVPPEWENEQPERYRKAIKSIHNAASCVCTEYDSIIRKGRRKLGV